MGQTLSRGLAGRLEKGMQRSRKFMEEDALKDIARKKDAAAKLGQKYSDPNAAHGGFQRGEGPQELWKDVEQQAYMEQHYHGKPTNKELPDDLIKFLNDVGPVQRKVDKDFTSPRLRQRLEQEVEHPPKDPQDPHRQRRDMPIMEQSEFSTTRTTNFSSSTAEEEGSGGLTDGEMYKLLLDNNLESYLEDEMDEKKKADRMELLKHTLDYIANPVLMKETNDNFVGTYKDRMSHLQKMYKLKVVPEDQIRLYIADATKDDDNEESTDKT